LWLAKHGIYPIIPHANTSRKEFGGLQPYPFFIRGTAEVLARVADVVVLTRRWHESGGARGELLLARKLSRPFVEMADGEERVLEKLKSLVPRSCMAVSPWGAAA